MTTKLPHEYSRSPVSDPHIYKNCDSMEWGSPTSLISTLPFLPLAHSSPSIMISLLSFKHALPFEDLCICGYFSLGWSSLPWCNCLLSLGPQFNVQFSLKSHLTTLCELSTFSAQSRAPAFYLILFTCSLLYLVGQDSIVIQHAISTIRWSMFETRPLASKLPNSMCLMLLVC